MISMAQAVIDSILLQLDIDRQLFPEFELSKSNGGLKLIGKGGFALVYEMVSKSNRDCKYAMKVTGLGIRKVSSDVFRDNIRLQSLLYEQTPHVVRILDSKELAMKLDSDGKILGTQNLTGEECDQEDGFVLQFVLMEKLTDIIVRDKFKRVRLQNEELLNEEYVLKFALQIGQAIRLAHKNNILHRDIKLENIFWDSEEKIYKLGDFGIAKYVEDGNAETIVYTDGYGAPEIERKLSDSYNVTADIYSFGITLYLLLNDLCFPGSNGYYFNIVQYSSEFIFPAPKNAAENLTRVIRKMCSYNSCDRYQSMDEVMLELARIGEGDKVLETEFEYPDIETETYHHKDVKFEYKNRISREGREDRKLYKTLRDSIFLADSLKFCCFFTVVLTFFLKGTISGADLMFDWSFFVLPILALIYALLSTIKEFKFVIGLLIIGIGVYSVMNTGIFLPQVMLMLFVVSGIPAIISSGAISTVLWITLEALDKLSFLNFIYKYDLGWILFGVVLISLLNYIDYLVLSEKTSEIGFYICGSVYGLLPFVLTGGGIVFLFIKQFTFFPMANFIDRLHLIRVGILVFIYITKFPWVYEEYGEVQGMSYEYWLKDKGIEDDMRMDE